MDIRGSAGGQARKESLVTARRLIVHIQTTTGLL